MKALLVGSIVLKDSLISRILVIVGYNASACLKDDCSNRFGNEGRIAKHMFHKAVAVAEYKTYGANVHGSQCVKRKSRSFKIILMLVVFKNYTDTMHVIENGRCSECVRVGLAEDGECGRLGAL